MDCESLQLQNKNLEIEMSPPDADQEILEKLSQMITSDEAQTKALIRYFPDIPDKKQYNKISNEQWQEYQQSSDEDDIVEMYKQPLILKKPSNKKKKYIKSEINQIEAKNSQYSQKTKKIKKEEIVINDDQYIKKLKKQLQEQSKQLQDRDKRLQEQGKQLQKQGKQLYKFAKDKYLDQYYSNLKTLLQNGEGPKIAQNMKTLCLNFGYKSSFNEQEILRKLIVESLDCLKYNVIQHGFNYCLAQRKVNETIKKLNYQQFQRFSYAVIYFQFCLWKKYCYFLKDFLFQCMQQAPISKLFQNKSEHKILIQLLLEYEIIKYSDSKKMNRENLYALVKDIINQYQQIGTILSTKQQDNIQKQKNIQQQKKQKLKSKIKSVVEEVIKKTNINYPQIASLFSKQSFILSQNSKKQSVLRVLEFVKENQMMIFLYASCLVELKDKIFSKNDKRYNQIEINKQNVQKAIKGIEFVFFDSPDYGAYGISTRGAIQNKSTVLQQQNTQKRLSFINTIHIFGQYDTGCIQSYIFYVAIHQLFHNLIRQLGILKNCESQSISSSSQDKQKKQSEAYYLQSFIAQNIIQFALSQDFKNVTQIANTSKNGEQFIIQVRKKLSDHQQRHSNKKNMGYINMRTGSCRYNQNQQQSIDIYPIECCMKYLLPRKNKRIN